MRVLALEPFYGGSHAAFLDGWSSASSAEWTILGLPAHKWKWRMRHAAITLSDDIRERVRGGEHWDGLVCSDMLGLAEFRGLAPAEIARLPAVAYFHENQLTYPVRRTEERDQHFAFTNLTTALAADAVWFNSAYHRDSFLDALVEFLRRMPDFQPVDTVQRVRARSAVLPPGIAPFPTREPRRPGPPRILWAARWEHDKNPEALFEALQDLKSTGREFRLSVIGQQFSEVPEVFERARSYFAEHIDHWGYLQSPAEYRDCLLAADIIVSTALHEFFGISVVESLAAGAYPLLPRRLAYPELLGDVQGSPCRFFYDGSAQHLCSRLLELVDRADRGELWCGDEGCCQRIAERYEWPRLAPRLDAALHEVVRSTADRQRG